MILLGLLTELRKAGDELSGRRYLCLGTGRLPACEQAQLDGEAQRPELISFGLRPDGAVSDIGAVIARSRSKERVR